MLYLFIFNWSDDFFASKFFFTDYVLVAFDYNID
jgi:hypothetical protein